eukprot:scaffold22310_cov59-Phaeocystis_antarctica.AAC.1
MLASRLKGPPLRPVPRRAAQLAALPHALLRVVVRPDLAAVPRACALRRVLAAAAAAALTIRVPSVGETSSPRSRTDTAAGANCAARPAFDGGGAADGPVSPPT